jgi:hypothetical protein
VSLFFNRINEYEIVLTIDIAADERAGNPRFLEALGEEKIKSFSLVRSADAEIIAAIFVLQPCLPE